MPVLHIVIRTTGFLMFFILVTRNLSNASSSLVPGGNLISAAAAEYNISAVTTEIKAVDVEKSTKGNKIRAPKSMKKFGKSKAKKNSRNLHTKDQNYGARKRFFAFTADYKGPRSHPPRNN